MSSLELPIIFDDNLKITSVSFVIADFNLFSCEFYSFVFKQSFYIDIILDLQYSHSSL